MSVLILVPARGGSKGIPGKNLRKVGGVSLVGRALQVAREFAEHVQPLGTFIHLDTDSHEIAAEGKVWGAEPDFLRPGHLAADTTSTIDSVLHAVATLARRGQRFRSLVLLQPTSPLRTVADVLQGWRLYQDPGAGLVVSLVQEGHPPELCVRLGADGEMLWAFPPEPVSHRRQDFPEAYRPNGAVYIASLDFLERERSFFKPGKALGYVMPATRSIDIDSETDLLIAEALLRDPGRAAGPSER